MQRHWEDELDSSAPAIADGGEWDVVIIGAGSAGSVLAARLSAAGRRVLVLEAGGRDGGKWMRIPLGIGKLIRDERVTWPFYTEPDEATGNRRLYWPRGKVLGGSSSINGMLWVRGDPARYDEWAEAGCPGWDWRAMEPMLRASEDVAPSVAALGSPGRGRGGPVSVEMLDDRDRVTAAFIAACVAAGIPANPDYNGPQHEGVARLQLSTRRGVRCSTADAYLHPALTRPNLQAETNARVRRIVFEVRRATGVEYVRGNQLRFAAARQEVILCAGAIQSPQVLELSGIGDAERLRGLGIPVVADLPGVGENLSDHYHIRVTYRAKDVLTINDLLRRPWLYGPRVWLEYQLRGAGLFSGSTASAHALARTTPETPYPDMKFQLHKITSPDRTAEAAGMGVDPFSGVSIGYFQLYPDSRGSVHATSADIAVPPRIVANYLAAATDRAAVVRGLRITRKIGGHPGLRRFLVEETRPGPAQESDDELLDYARANGQTSYHPIGTCRMGTDPGAVVDPQCRVHGVDGLRVADASVMPFIVSSNTNAPSIAIGERASQIILAQANA